MYGKGDKRKVVNRSLESGEEDKEKKAFLKSKLLLKTQSD